MGFVGDILRHRSVSIVGLAKNAGKTECLNYILRCGQAGGRCIAVTSIGLDGETVDQVKRTPKPEIEIYEGMVFATSEAHYRQKRLVAEVLDVSDRRTALGRVVTARALTSGKVLLSGPSDTQSVRELVDGFGRFGVQTSIVDGALSRLSHGSPAVTDAMVLVTGAALSGNIPRLVRETKYVYDRTGLEAVDAELYRKLAGKENGVWAVDEQGEVHDLGIPSVLMLERAQADIFRYGNTIYVPGVVSDRLLENLRVQKHAADIVLIIRDFTRVFASMETYYAFLAKGGRIKVLQKSEVLAVCVNPVSPDGYRLDADRLADEMQKALGVPVYDVMRMEDEIPDMGCCSEKL